MEEFSGDRLAHARMQLERFHAIPLSKDSPRDIIRDSWRRCLEAGLDPAKTPKQVDSSSQELRELIDQESFLLHLARSEFVRLQRQLPGNICLLGFANRDAVLMDVACSNPSVRSASKAAPGSCWNEKFRGTNAIGTAAVSRGPVAVCLQEHFLRHYGALTCVAATVCDPDGDLVGILHVSSNSAIRQQHTMSLLSMSAMHIESELFRQRYSSGVVLQFHSRDEFANTLDAGLIALDEDGRIISSNRQARFFLEGLPLEAGRHFDEIFRIPFKQFMASPQIAGDLTQLVDIKGSSSSVCVHVPGGNAKNGWGGRRVSESGGQKRQTPGFVSSDPAVSAVVSLAKRAVTMSIPILIRGETGTGKELLARYAHRVSGRSGRFVAVNCAAVPESLIEAELFGYREGAFTGARNGGSEGLILQANGGTLFLDEIGDMPLNMQPTLLRFLDSWMVRPIGSGREVKVDIQLITATNCDLEQAVAEKRFRRDLLHRIEGVEILLPTLRERSDFDEIVRDLLAGVSPHLQIAEEALRLLREQPWSGNMRELRNILVRSALMSTGHRLTSETVERVLSKHHDLETGRGSESQALFDLRSRAIAEAYRRNNGNISRAAQTLRVSRNTIYRELRQLGLMDGGVKGSVSHRATGLTVDRPAMSVQKRNIRRPNLFNR